MKKKLIINFSGGRTSAYMTKYLLDNHQNEYDMRIVFCNTGKEREETLIFIDQCQKWFNYPVVWIECVTNLQKGKGNDFKIVDFRSASRNGEPFEDAIRKHGIPNAGNPWCSKELKERTNRAYRRSIGWTGAFIALGIRNDEIDRMSAERKKYRLIYPLIQMKPTSRKEINLFWSQQSFDLQLKSYEGNCDLCWKKSFSKLATIARENPQRLEWWRNMENGYNWMRTSKNFFRQGKNADHIKFLSTIKLKPIHDESKDTGVQFNLFSDEIIDQPNGCEESCEGF